MSACDDFVRRIKANSIGKVVGLSADGSTSPSRYTYNMSLLDGTEFSIVMTIGTAMSADGKIDLEGNPAEVDIQIYPSKENRENYLKYVLKVLKDKAIFPL